ncbi:hypothetical protein AVEN_93430-1 [Araneus ventricosus]|uniref:Uncharacterized protein n=1 Tax=Araneus ventricosus TaxID=182803 RepID=A0A4Y2APH3_ARAVE|nr:hypothetical protein AVEN_93430-1 [Araneus ventricosus]
MRRKATVKSKSTRPMRVRFGLHCEVLKSTRQFSHGKSDRASQVASRELPEKRADKAFTDCVIPEGLRLKFTAIWPRVDTHGAREMHCVRLEPMRLRS